MFNFIVIYIIDISRSARCKLPSPQNRQTLPEKIDLNKLCLILLLFIL